MKHFKGSKQIDLKSVKGGGCLYKKFITGMGDLLKLLHLERFWTIAILKKITNPNEHVYEIILDINYVHHLMVLL